MYEWSLYLLLGSIATLIFVVVTGKKMNMNIRYLIVWIIWSIVIMILSIFPQIIEIIARLLHIATPALAILFVFIFLAYIISYYLFINASISNNKINKLIYEISLLKKEIEELKKCKEKGNEE